MTDRSSDVTARIAALIAEPRYHGLGRAIALTQFGMFFERLARAFWPLWTLILATIAAFAFGAQTLLPPSWLWVPVAVLGLFALWLLVRGLRRFRLPAWTEAMARLDATLPGRPLAALTDEQVLGDDPQTHAVWEAHLRRMADRAAQARAPTPNLSVADRDPFGLRFIAVTAFAMALLFGAIWRVTDVSEAVASAPLPGTPGGGPSWEGWVEPPLYTGLPSIYLNDLMETEFSAPEGSQITLRIYGDPDAIEVVETVSGTPVETAGPQEMTTVRTLPLRRSGTLSIDGPGGRNFAIDIIPDLPPAIELVSAPEAIPPSQMQFEYGAEDDYGVVSGEAIVQLNPDGADRRHGLAVDPEPREPLVLSLPMPFAGSRDDFSELFVDDLAEHPLANLPVTLTLVAADDLGQQGESTHEVARLPGRPFYVPLAGAIAEQRRDLLWSRENAARAARLLRAIRYEPDMLPDYMPGGLFPDPEAGRLVTAAIDRLEGEPELSREARDEIADLLWQAALLVEEYIPETAEERLARAQDRLAEAMRQGANDAEIAELMEEMREAMDDYMQELADQFERDGTDQPDRGEGGQTMSQMDLDEMMRRIEELMAEGRTAEAMALLEQLRQMMENMEIVEGEGEGDGPRLPGEQAMEDLQDTLRDQQDLSDDSFQELQEQFDPGRQQGQQQGQQGQQQGQRPGAQQDQAGREGGQQGGANGGAMDPESLAERQEALRQELEDQAQRLPGAGTEEGDEARRQLEEAGRAMDEAAEALENDDLAGAIDRQAEAMEALREGLQSLGQALSQDREQTDDEGPAQGRAEGSMTAEDRPLTDPLGRQAGNSGSLATDQSIEEQEEAFRRARELLDEIRRRTGDRDRSELELEYLRRLLDQF